MNTTRRLAATLLPLLLLAAAACTDDSRSGGGDDDNNATNNASNNAANNQGNNAANNGDPISAEEFTQAVAEAYCQYLESCQIPEGDFRIIRTLILAAGNCEEVFGNLADFTELGEKIEAGELIYDADAAAECLRGVTEQCILFEGNAACDQAVRGTVAEDGFCESGDDCADGLYCNLFDAEETCDQRCVPKKAAGEPCSSDDECVATAPHVPYCRYAPGSDGGSCAEIVTHAEAAVGEPCGVMSYQGIEGVFLNELCQLGLWCQLEDDAAEVGTCAEPLATNAPCDDDGDVCADGAFCVANTCRAVTILNTAGEACDPNMLQLCNPVVGLACVDGMCRGGGDGSAGSDCVANELARPCDEGLYCDGDEGALGSCVAKKAEGVECFSDSECSSDLCDFSGNTPVCGQPFDPAMCN